VECVGGVNRNVRNEVQEGTRCHVINTTTLLGMQEHFMVCVTFRAVQGKVKGKVVPLSFFN